MILKYEQLTFDSCKDSEGLSAEPKGAIGWYRNSCLHGSQGKRITWWWQRFCHSCFFSFSPFCRKNYVTQHWFIWAWFTLGQPVEGLSSEFRWAFPKKEKKNHNFLSFKVQKSRGDCKSTKFRVYFHSLELPRFLAKINLNSCWWVSASTAHPSISHSWQI